MATKTTSKDEPKVTTQTVQTSAGEQKIKTAANENDLQPSEGAKNAIQPVDTSDKRWFQTNAAGATDGREALTKEEARARGFHWLETDELQPKKG